MKISTILFVHGLAVLLIGITALLISERITKLETRVSKLEYEIYQNESFYTIDNSYYRQLKHTDIHDQTQTK